MTIHLLRHFKVQDNTNSWLNSEEFNTWVETYDTAPLKIIDVALPDDIELVVCSTLSRAKRTASEFKNIEIVYSDKLIEVGSRVFFNTNIKLHKHVWFTIGSLMWYYNKLDGENRVDSENRAQELIKEIKSLGKKNVLLVSHGFFMKVLVKELKKEGFEGEIDHKPKNAKVYSYSL